MYMAVYVVLGLIATICACIAAWYFRHIHRCCSMLTLSPQGRLHIDHIQLCGSASLRPPREHRFVSTYVASSVLITNEDVADNGCLSAPFKFFTQVDTGELTNR